MSTPRRSCSGPPASAHVSARLFAAVVLFIAFGCLLAGYLLGRMARTDVKHTNELISANLTTAADSLLQKAKRIPPKAVHHSDPEKIKAKLYSIFQCNSNNCGPINNHNLSEYVKNSLNFRIFNLIKSIHNASLYLDTLR
ncbi:unnamed protein product [Diatraea saccharalis]|uniref:Uncharacterized protein n=1 Tax=Diatraea saccharalis TaxID=40085 RepID=A0A9N9WEB0_9NEOP|nr:unnamed protein product [Diatraea saccharalis]